MSRSRAGINAPPLVKFLNVSNSVSHSETRRFRKLCVSISRHRCNISRQFIWYSRYVTERRAFWSSSCPARWSDAVTYRHVQSPACIKSRATTDTICPSLSYARGSSRSSSSSYVRTRPGNPIIRRLYHKHTGHHRQSHWNVLNGTNVLTYVLFDQPFPRSRAGICATAIIRYCNITRVTKFKYCKNRARRFQTPVIWIQFPTFPE